MWLQTKNAKRHKQISILGKTWVLKKCQNWDCISEWRFWNGKALNKKKLPPVKQRKKAKCGENTLYLRVHALVSKHIN